MPNPETLNEKAWQILFTQRPILHDVDANGLHHITATEINQIGKREARLMTKFDHTINLPEQFKQNGLTILPNSRGSYIIGRFECYAKLDQTTDDEIIGKSFPEELKSINPDDLYSEPAALLCALHAGLIADVLEEDVSLTVAGRMSTGDFDFSIQTKLGGIISPYPIRVEKSQCEIDGGFEGQDTFAIIEVKNQEIDDFHIRQLYYPYRLWLRKMEKRVVPVFLTYSNEIFTFSVYDFTDTNNFNSLQRVQHKRYQIVPTSIEIADLRRILSQTHAQPEPHGVPFPQADSFERVIDMLARLRGSSDITTREDITTNYAFDIRQTQYYTNAGRYLGLIERRRDRVRGVNYALTTAGLHLMSRAPRNRNLALVELILSRSVFRSALEYYLSNSQAPSYQEIEDLIQQAGISLTGTTPHRRASSVIGWIRWMIKLTADA